MESVGCRSMGIKWRVVGEVRWSEVNEGKRSQLRRR